jgi:hypothetical protein
MQSLMSPVEVSSPAHVATDVNWRWKVTYSTIKDLDCGRLKAYDGTMLLLMAEKWLILKNAKDYPIAVQSISDVRASQAHTLFCVGAKVRFPFHSVRMGICLASPPMPQVSAQTVQPNDGTNKSYLVSVAPESRSGLPANIASDGEMSSAVYEAMTMGLDFSTGISFAKSIRRKYFSAVHPSRDSGHFTMVVSFGRTNFQLSEDSASIALEAAIGGFCGSLKVSSLRERVYYFLVSNKQVGFDVLNLKSFVCPKFKCFFHQWGNGGPNWTREFNDWQKECNEEWTLVSPSRRRMQLALRALRAPKPKSAIKSASLVRRKLPFSSTIEYSACKGYKCVKKLEKKSETQMVPSESCVGTTSQANIPFGTVAHCMSNQPCMEKLSDKGKSLLSEEENSNMHTSSASEEGVSRDVN